MSEPRLKAPAEVLDIHRKLEAAGFDTWAVGGAVRDALAGLEPGDWDLTTAARPADVQRIFRRTVPIGIDHGTVGVLTHSGRMIEVTTFRRDVETFGRKARVVFADRIEDDLDRRDFTINAVAWNPATDEVRDPHDGVGDLKKGILRTVGSPSDRFEEDRLRVLRALRFAGRFNLRIEPATWSAIREKADDLTILSAERIRDELLKALGGAGGAAAMKCYRDSGVLDSVLPSVGFRNWCSESRWEAVQKTIDAIGAGHPLVRLAALLGAVPGPRTQAGDLAREITHGLRMSNAEQDRVSHLVAMSGSLPTSDTGDGALIRWMRMVGKDYLGDLFRLESALASSFEGGHRDIQGICKRVRSLMRAGAVLTARDLAIDGGDLRRMGIRPGPVYSEIFDVLLDRVADDPGLNSAERLEEIVRDLP